MEIRAHSQSERAEFEALFSRSYQRAYNLAFRYTGNESDAEDLTQDAFIRAWGSYHRYDHSRSFEVWLLRILSNLAIDRWRRQATARTYSLDQTQTTPAGDVQLASLIPDRAAGPEQQCLTRAMGEQIHSALKQLPAPYRTAIILTDIEEWTYEEVAEKMRCPVGTVRSRLHRGRQMLRHYLRQMQADEMPLSSSMVARQMASAA